MIICVKKTFLRTDRRTTQNYSSEPHKIETFFQFCNKGYSNSMIKILRLYFPAAKNSFLELKLSE